ncbi:MAG: glycosyltransferase family 2 protein [Bacteroidales bacterium]|nr:glycosyltransferase family 2 protein [Bacteroidales bacterium]MCF8405820.1 glycosyltransferase family 2 protein [Bacteroidales bacterium]
MLKISIAFPIFNGLNYTQQCLKNLFEEHKIEKLDAEYSLVIVDDNSTDGSWDWIQKHYPQVNLLKGTGDLWWGGGINKAVRYALDELKADYILWWNNDIVAKEDYFTKIPEILADANVNQIIGSKIYFFTNPELVWSMGGEFNPKTGKYGMKGMYSPDGPEFNKPLECDWLPGMGTIIHKSVFEKVGFVDNESFPQYHGDSDFTFRAKKAGFKVLCNPELIIYNDTRNTGLSHGESFKKLFQSMKTIKSNFNIKQELKFYSKHAQSSTAKWVVYKRFAKYIGGFFKWKILGLFGIKRKEKVLV